MASEQQVKRNLEEQNIKSEVWTGSDGKKHQLVIFDSLGDLVTKVNTGLEKGTWTNYGTDEGGSKTQSNTWRYGNEYQTEQATEEALIKGKASETVMKQIYELDAKLKPTLERRKKEGISIKRRRVFGEEGSQLDIDRLLCGDPMHWSRMTKNNTPPLVKLVMSVSANAGVTEDSFVKGAALLITTCRQLESSGFSVEINAIACTSANDYLESFTYMCPVKKANERLDVMRVSTIGLQGIFRKYGFDVRENLMEGGFSDGGNGRDKGIRDSLREKLRIKDCNIIDVAALSSNNGRLPQFFDENLEKLYIQLGLK